MKIAVSGKGGVGKSTVVGMLARVLADDGWRVLAVDADPDANLASALGIPAEKVAGLQPISGMTSLARERTGASDGPGNHYILNPRVDDIPDAFCIDHHGVKMLLMGTVDHAGTGCVCPEHALVRTLLRHILTRRKECVLLDMEAGIEHFGRGTVEAVDVLIVVVEPGERSLQTGRHIEALAAELGIKRVVYVANKIATAQDQTFLEQALKDKETLAFLPFDDTIRAADQAGASCYDTSPAARARAVALEAALQTVMVLPAEPVLPHGVAVSAAVGAHS